MRILLTGGIGCGKSIVANIFKQINIPVWHVDDENSDAKKVIYSGALLLTSVMAVTHFAQPPEDRKKQNLGFYSLVAGAVGLCIAVEITF